MFKRFIKYYKPQRKLFIEDMIAAFFIAIADLAYPIISRQMVNDFIPNKELRSVIIFGLGLLFIYIIKMFLAYFVQYYGHLVGVYMQAEMRRDMFIHLQKLPYSYYDEHETGTIMSRMTNDLADISELAHHGPEDLFISIIILVGSFFFLCSIDISLTLIIFICIPILVIFSMFMRKRMSNAFMASRVEIGSVNANLENSIGGIRVSKAYTNAHHELEKFQVGNKKFVTTREVAYKAMGHFFAGTGFITDFLNVLVLIAGGIYVYNGAINYGDLLAYMLFINMFIAPIKKLINFMEQYQSGMTGFKRFCEILDEEIETENPNAKDLEKIKGHIIYKDVSFHYEEGTEILKHLNLEIKPGEKVALVGPSGGGKTTICHLLPQFYPLDSGEILIDDHNIKDITYDSLRKNIGIVQQDVFLFAGTMKDNIAYGNLSASDDEIIEAAKKANIHEYIMTLEKGYETEVGERGVRLSGGQKQRLSIARVFLKNPSILILDEATSALDNATENFIQKSLDDLALGRTTLIVAHRLSTIKNANKIVVISKGKVLEEGTHEALLANSGLYTELYMAQFANQEA